MTISGPTEARVGDVVGLTCSTAPSNPLAEIKWMLGGRQIRNASSRTIVSPEGKSLISTNLGIYFIYNKIFIICKQIKHVLKNNLIQIM